MTAGVLSALVMYLTDWLTLDIGIPLGQDVGWHLGVRDVQQGDLALGDAALEDCVAPEEVA